MKAAEKKKPTNAARHTTLFFKKNGGQHFFGSSAEPVSFFQKSSSPVIQPKLAIGQPNDKYEKEADAVAQKVVSSSAPAIQKKCDECEKEESIQKQALPEEEELQMQPLEEDEELLQTQPMEEEEDLQMKPLLQIKGDANIGGTEAGSSIENKIGNSRGRGRSLDSSRRSFMENRMQTDFSSVNIHTGNEAVQMNRQLGARAFTVGSDIYFNKGEYRPETSEGKKLLAHELTHTVQQQGTSTGSIQRAHVCENDASIGSSLGLSCHIASMPNAGPTEAVAFEIEKSEINSEGDKTSLSNFVDNWKASGGTDRISVNGFASCDGPEILNWQLSCERANAIAQQLIVLGVDPELIEINANGETDQFSSTNLSSNRAATVGFTSSIGQPQRPLFLNRKVSADQVQQLGLLIRLMPLNLIHLFWH